MVPRTEGVNYESGDGETQLSGYIAAPNQAGPHPAVLVLRGVAGPDTGYIEIAERIAGWGYFAFLHGWKIRGDDPPDKLVNQDLAGAMTFLRARGDVDRSRLAVVGFCRGGVHSLLLATAHSDIRLVVIFHGFAFRPEKAQLGLEPFDLAQEVSVPTLILHGTADERAPIEGMRHLEAHSSALKRPIRFKYYDGIGHGFAVRTHPGFDAPTAKDSFEEARRFIQKEMP